MKSSRIVLAGAAVAAAASLVLLPSAAIGHTDSLFTWAYSPVGTDAGGFATTSKTDASLALLGADTLPILEDVSGMEVCEETGYAVGWVVVNSELELPSIATWDHTTGDILTGPEEIVLDTEEGIDYVVELDTLDGCRVIALAEVDSDGDYWAIIEIDPATGDATVLVELPDLPAQEWFEYTGLATDSAGTTYIFIDVDNVPGVAVVDFDSIADPISLPIALTGLMGYFESDGFTQGVDFDAADGLWMVTGVNEEEEYHLVSYTAGADLPSATPADVGILPYYGDGLQIYAPIPLTAEGATPAPEPQLAATGVEPATGVALAAGILLLGGAALVLTRRRAAE